MAGSTRNGPKASGVARRTSAIESLRDARERTSWNAAGPKFVKGTYFFQALVNPTCRVPFSVSITRNLNTPRFVVLQEYDRRTATERKDMEYGQRELVDDGNVIEGQEEKYYRMTKCIQQVPIR